MGPRGWQRQLHQAQCAALCASQKVSQRNARVVELQGRVPVAQGVSRFLSLQRAHAQLLPIIPVRKLEDMAPACLNANSKKIKFCLCRREAQHNRPGQAVRPCEGSPAGSPACTAGPVRGADLPGRCPAGRRYTRGCLWPPGRLDGRAGACLHPACRRKLQVTYPCKPLGPSCAFQATMSACRWILKVRKSA